jgi:hypothetical protein
MTLAANVWRKSSYSDNAGNCVEAAVLGSARWHKSSHSGNAGNCVEAAVLGSAQWHKSSRSGSTGECVEVADGLPNAVAVRDSKNPDGPALVFSRDEWTTFVTKLRSGESGRF